MSKLSFQLTELECLSDWKPNRLQPNEAVHVTFYTMERNFKLFRLTERKKYDTPACLPQWKRWVKNRSVLITWKMNNSLILASGFIGRYLMCFINKLTWMFFFHKTIVFVLFSPRWSRTLRLSVDQAPDLKVNTPWTAMKRTTATVQRATNTIFSTLMMWRVGAVEYFKWNFYKIIFKHFSFHTHFCTNVSGFYVKEHHVRVERKPNFLWIKLFYVLQSVYIHPPWLWYP